MKRKILKLETDLVDKNEETLQDILNIKVRLKVMERDDDEDIKRMKQLQDDSRKTAERRENKTQMAKQIGEKYSKLEEEARIWKRRSTRKEGTINKMVKTGYEAIPERPKEI